MLYRISQIKNLLYGILLCRYDTDQIAFLIFDRGKEWVDCQKLFVMLVGFSKSGKRTFIDSHTQVKFFFRINTDEIHAMLNKRFPSLLQDDLTVRGPAYLLRQYFTKCVRDKMEQYAFARGLNVVSDSCNLKRDDRVKRLEQAKLNGYRTIVIWVQCEEEELLRRLDAADREKIRFGKKPAWRTLYLNIQKPRFQPPDETHETDRLYIFNSQTSTPTINVRA